MGTGAADRAFVELGGRDLRRIWWLTNEVYRHQEACGKGTVGGVYVGVGGGG